MKINKPRVAIFSDLHLGVHSNSSDWHNYAIEWAHWFKEECKRKNIKDYCAKNNIDAQIRDDGVLYGATNKFHKGAFESLIKDLKENQINSWERLSKEKVQDLTKSKKFIDGYFSPIGGSLQPAFLVRGLKKKAENIGIKIFEQSNVISYTNFINYLIIIIYFS